jgi:hypothetical protein
MSVDEMLSLVGGAGFVFRGTAVRRGAEADLGPTAAGKTVTVEVEEVFRGTDVTRDLVGRNVIVVSEDAADIEPAAHHVFFTNVVSLGDPVVVREVGRRRDASHESLRDVAESARITAERPLAARVAAADMIVAGEVAGSTPVGEKWPPVSEHDPNWWIARLTVERVIKGRGPRRRIDVLFANSDDIVWYQSPKLHQGVSGIFLLHSRTEDVAVSDVPPTVYQVIDPLDFLPAERLPDVQRMLGDDSGERTDG